MSGVTLEFDSRAALATMRDAAAAMGNPEPMLRDIGEELMIIHDQRFAAQKSPAGVSWAPLSPAYLKTKKKNRNKILQRDGYLKNLMRYLVQGSELLFGSDRVYAAIHNFGGEIKIRARRATVHFKQNKDGTVGNRFVARKKSNFAQDVKIGAYVIKMPQREFLGTSAQDDIRITEIAFEHLQRALGNAGT